MTIPLKVRDFTVGQVLHYPLKYPDVERTFFAQVEQKCDWLAGVLSKWRSPAQKQKIEQAITETTYRTLALYPDLGDMDYGEVDRNDFDDEDTYQAALESMEPYDDEYEHWEYAADLAPKVQTAIEQALDAVVALLTHVLSQDDPNHFDYMCTEIKHAVTSRLIGELAHDLEQAASDTTLPGLLKG